VWHPRHRLLAPTLTFLSMLPPLCSCQCNIMLGIRGHANGNSMQDRHTQRGRLWGPCDCWHAWACELLRPVIVHARAQTR
jgi:hypothetical protein